MQKTILQSAILLTLFFLPSVRKVSAEDFIRFASDIEVVKDGSIKVVEIVQVDFGFEQSHGIYRTLPLVKKVGRESSLLDYKILSIMNEQSGMIPYNLFKENNNIKIRIGDPSKTVNGIQTYIFTYIVKGVLTSYPDCDELRWNITGTDFWEPVRSVEVTVKFPPSVISREVRVGCFTGLEENGNENCMFTTQSEQIRFHAKSPVSAGEGFTVLVKFPPDFIVQDKISGDNSFSKNLVGIAITLSNLLFFLARYFLVIYKYMFLYEKEY